MLTNLTIQNVGLIKHAEIEFHNGLNILSGETGAGKSMIISALSFLLGQRVPKDFIRSGEESATVEGMLYIKGIATLETLKSLGVEVDEDRALLLMRSTTQAGKSQIKINGKAVPLAMLKEIAQGLFDFHGQHEHQSLLNPNKHLELLDRFCGGEMEDFKNELSLLIQKYKETLAEIKSISGDPGEREAKLSVLKFQIEEIEGARLKADEEDKLLERKRFLNSSEKIIKNTFLADALLYGADNDELSAFDKISKAQSLLQEISDYDSKAESLAHELDSISAQLLEIIRELSSYNTDMEYEPNEIEDIEARLNTIYLLKKKYGESIKDILSFHAEASKKLEALTGAEEKITVLEQQRKGEKSQILFICEKISKRRLAAASEIKKQIEDILKELGMKSAGFDISVERKNEFNRNGFDKVEFLISTNAGEAMMPLAKIASGGEMSRVMLALKTVLSHVETIETFIFDEIDTGVSGRTAQKVAEKLNLIAGTHQILCITHLPQIAAMADAHFLIEKQTNKSENKTTTEIKLLNEEKSIHELARLTGGAKITDVTLKAAEEMKLMARELKVGGERV